MTELDDDRAAQRRLEGLSPFELKGHLMDLAGASSRKTAHAMLNAGRGNPKWTTAPPREAFFLLGRFAVLESRRSRNEFPAVAGMPGADGITERFPLWLDQNAGEPGANLLRRILNRMEQHRSDAVLHEPVDGIIGDNHPVPDRILPFVAESVHEYVVRAMGDRKPETPYDLFAVEGGTAAMCYVFDSLQVNRVLRRGDRIALMTPIFTPYLEIPHLERYDFDVVEVSASRGTEGGFHTWDHDDAELDKLTDPSVRMVYLVNPSNPPSVALSERALDRIRDIVENRNRDLVIVTDDVYGTFVRGFTSLMEAQKKLGYPMASRYATDFVYLGTGLVPGILIGQIVIPVGNADPTLGTGRGALLAGLVFGYLRAKRPTFGTLHPAAAGTMKDLGLATFIAAVGMSAGPSARQLVQHYGVMLPVAAVLTTLVPATISIIVGWKVLKIEPPLLMGAVAGQQCSTPAISQVVSTAGNSVPMIAYTITYAISNILLPLTGPVIVALAGMVV